MARCYVIVDYPTGDCDVILGIPNPYDLACVTDVASHNLRHFSSDLGVIDLFASSSFPLPCSPFLRSS